MFRKFRKYLSVVLIGSLLLSMLMLPGNIVVAEETGVDLIPNTSRVEKDYDKSFLSVTGFAAAGVNDRSEYVGTDYYRTASNAREVLEALLDAREGEVKVIEITDDINFGWKAIALTAEEEEQFGMIKAGAEPSSSHTNPLIIESGVSELEIGNVDGLTIFSTSGNTLKHVEIKLQSSANDIIIRNLGFDGMWQWDDSGRHKEVGWGFINVNGATNIWIDHCTFTIASDGNVDMKNGATNVTFSWNEFGLPADQDPDPNSSVYQSIHYMEEQYAADLLLPNSRYYTLRDEGATVGEIMAYTAYHSKVHLAGSGDKDYTDYVRANGEVVPDGNQRIKLTMAYNHYMNVGQRLPMIRQGTGHIFNNYFDNSGHQHILDSVEAIAAHANYRLARGINSRNGASIAGDTNVYNAFNEPISGAESQGDDINNMNKPWDVLFQNAKNHFLLVNSQITNTQGETYTGSSWDNNGDNLFTKGVTWDDKSTIGNWAWSSSIVGAEEMDKEKPPSEPFTFEYHYDEQLPYEYQIFPLADVVATVTEFSGSGKLDLTPVEWLTVNYNEGETTDADSPGTNQQNNDDKQTEDRSDGEKKSALPMILIVGGIVLIILIGWLFIKKGKQ